MKSVMITSRQLISNNTRNNDQMEPTYGFLMSEEKKAVQYAIKWYLSIPTLSKSKNLRTEQNNKTHIVRKKRGYVKKAVLRRMLDKCGYRCCICHRPYFQLYHKDEDITNNTIDNLIPICSNHDPNDVNHLNFEKVQKRRRNMCCICNKPFISLHHIDHDVTNVKEDNLVQLCRECHIHNDNLSVKKMKALRDNWTAFLVNKLTR